MDKKALRQEVVMMVGEILNLEARDVGVDTPLQDLGFDSALLVALVDKLSDALDEEIHPGIFLEHTTINAFLAYLIEHKHDAASSLLKKSSSRTVEKVAPNRSADANGGSALNGGEWGEFEKLFLDPQHGPAHQRESATSGPEHGSAGLPNKVPVIIGGGISAMLISHKLSEKAIPHVVIGPPQTGDTPKLGESMTEAVSFEFTRNFKQFAHCFFRKEMTPFYMGDIVAGLRFDNFRSLLNIFSDVEPHETFIHIDRIGFDQALYEEVIQNKECHWIDDLVNDVDYCKETDGIKSITFGGNRTINPSYVWDCTNHVRLLGRKINIPHVDMDPQRQVIFTHYVQKTPEDLCKREDLPWMHATSLLRADRDIDRLEGVSWLIPLGRYASVGISMEPEAIGDNTPEQIMASLTKAYKVRGLDYSKYFPLRKEIVSVPSQHFMYERFYGKNWALVGGSAANAWFPSGSNISQVACMASMADKIIVQPEVYGEHYARHVRGFTRTHEVYNTLLKSDLGALDAIKFLSGIVEQSRRRISSYFMFRDGLDSKNAKTAKQLWEEEILIDKTYFEYLRQIATHAKPKDIREQTASIFENIAKLKERGESVKLPYLRGSEVRSELRNLFL